VIGATASELSIASSARGGTSFAYSSVPLPHERHARLEGRSRKQQTVTVEISLIVANAFRRV